MCWLDKSLMNLISTNIICLNPSVYPCVSVFTNVLLLLMMAARHLDLEINYNVTLSGVFLVKHIYVLEFCKVHSLHMMMIVIGYENEDLRLQISNTFKSLHKASTVLSLNRYTALVSAHIVLLPFVSLLSSYTVSCTNYF